MRERCFVRVVFPVLERPDMAISGRCGGDRSGDD